MDQRLHANQPVGDPFTTRFPIEVFLDVYTDGWYVEYAIDREDVTDKNTLNWKRYHNTPLQEHGDLSHVLIYGMRGALYRLKGGTQGATAFSQAVGVLVRT